MVYAGTTNNMNGRSVLAIALNSSNEHGGHYFMSLYSGKRIHSYEWTELPIDEDVTDRVEELADLEEAPEMKRGYLISTWKQRVLEDLGSHTEDEDTVILNIHGGEEDIVQNGHEDNNDEELGGNDIIINEEEYQGLVELEEQVDANYVSEEDSLNDETNSEEQEVWRKITTDDEDEMDDKVVMINDEEEVDVDTYEMNKTYRNS